MRKYKDILDAPKVLPNNVVKVIQYILGVIHPIILLLIVVWTIGMYYGVDRLIPAYRNLSNASGDVEQFMAFLGLLTIGQAPLIIILWQYDESKKYAKSLNKPITVDFFSKVLLSICCTGLGSIIIFAKTATFAVVGYTINYGIHWYIDIGIDIIITFLLVWAIFGIGKMD